MIFTFFLPDDPEAFIPFVTIVLVDRGFRKYRYPYNPKDSLPMHKFDANTLVERLIHFEDSFWNGHANKSVWLRSEEIYSGEQDGSFVRPLVGFNFNDFVINTKKDALVLFYAAWCGHCKKFEAKYKLLAEKFANVKSIGFFKIDVTKNDIDHQEIIIHRVPYVRFFGAYDKLHPIIFDHARQDVVEFGTSFLQTYAQIPFDLNRMDGQPQLVEL